MSNLASESKTIAARVGLRGSIRCIHSIIELTCLDG